MSQTDSRVKVTLNQTADAGVSNRHWVGQETLGSLYQVVGAGDSISDCRGRRL